MSPIARREWPAVTLEEGAAGSNRCPACGEPLFAWIETSAGGLYDHRVIDRCENCGLACGRDAAPSPEDAIAEIRREAGGAGANGGVGFVLRTPNAASLQAWLGAASWTGLRTDELALQLTPRAIELLLAKDGLEVARVRQLPTAGIASMWQTILNLMTFNRDFAARAVSGSLKPSGGRGLATFAIDATVTVLAAAPVAAISFVLEGGALLARRGGAIELSAVPRGPRR